MSNANTAAYDNVPTDVITAALEVETERLPTLVHGTAERRECWQLILDMGWELKRRNG